VSRKSAVLTWALGIAALASAVLTVLFGVKGDVLATLCLALNAFLLACGASAVRLSERRGAEAAHADAETRALQEREHFLEERVSSLQSEVEVLSALRELSRALSSETRFEPVAAEILGIVDGLMSPEAVGLYLATDGRELKLAALLTGGRTRFAEAAAETAGALSAQVAATAWSARRLHREEETLAVSLTAGEAELGVLAVRMGDTARAAAAERTLRELAKHLAMALQHPALRSAAVTDVLTGLYTKRHLLERAPALLTQLRARGERAALLLADLDHFKKINDTYGHPAGDKVLREISKRLAASIRGSDTAYRYGGEEIACLLPTATGSVAMRVANRIRREVSATPVETGPGGPLIPVTLSIGAAILSPEMTSWGDLLSAADQALYQAKAAGRDRAVLFHERK